MPDSSSRYNPAAPSAAARMNAARRGSVRAVQAQANSMFALRHVPDVKLVSTLSDVTSGLGLTEEAERRVQGMVADGATSYGRRDGMHRGPVNAAALFVNLRNAEDMVPSGARRELMTRAKNYWSSTGSPQNAGRRTLKSVARIDFPMQKAMYIGPKGGKYADPEHKIPWTEDKGGQVGFSFPKACKQCKGKGTITTKQSDLFQPEYGGKTVTNTVKCRRCKGSGMEPKARKSGDLVVTDDALQVVHDWGWASLRKSAEGLADFIDSLIKAKYIRRVATGNPKRPWRYIYHRQEKSRWQRAAWEQVKAALRKDQEDHGKSSAHRDGARAVHYGENVAKLNPQVLKLALAHLEATHGKRAVDGLQKILDHAEGKADHPDAKKPAPPPETAPKPAPKPAPAPKAAPADPKAAGPAPAPPTPAKRPEPAPSSPKPPPSRKGADTMVFVAGEGGQPVGMKASYKLMEAAEVKASHNPQNFSKNKEYPADVQERAYHRDQSEQAKVIRNAQQIRPEFVVNTNPDAVNGPPIISPDGVVLGGNSRTMSMQLAYSDHPEKAAELKSYLADHAATVGLDRAAVEGMKNPILVRVVEPADDSMDSKRLLVRQMNESFTQGMDPRTMQVALGRRLSTDTMDNLSESMEADESLSAFLASSRAESFVNGLRRDGIIDRRNANQYMRRGAKGKLNEDGKRLVSRILVGRMLNDADILSHTSPRTIDSLARSTPAMMQATAYGEGYDISADMKVAVDALNDLQVKVENDLIPALDSKMSERKMNGLMDHFALLPGMGDAHPVTKNKTAQALLEVLIRKPGSLQMSGVFREFAKRASQNPEGQGGLFGAGPTPQEVLQGAIKASLNKSGDGLDGRVFQKSRRVQAFADMLTEARRLYR